MKLGSKDISKVYLGSKEILKVYLGSKEIFTSEISPNGNPSNVVLTVLSDTSIQCDWTNGATNQDGTYVLYKLHSDSSWSTLTALGSLTTKNITGLTANSNYDVKVAHYKGSKLSNYSSTVSATTFTTEAQAIFTKAVELSETPNYLTKLAVDNAIKSLISNSLWSNEDSVQVYRSWAENSSLINWKTALVQASKQKGAGDYPTFSTNKGWLTDGSQNFIDTGYNLSTGANFTLDDSGFIYKTSRTLSGNGFSLGAYASSTARTQLTRSAVGSHAGIAINGGLTTSNNTDSSDTIKNGYWGISRKSNALVDFMKDAGIDADKSSASTSRVNKTCTIGKANGLTTFAIEEPELIIFRKKFTQAQFLKYQEIFNQYFYELDIALAEDVKLHGAVGDGVTDDIDAITTALANYNSIRIGLSRSDVFLVSKEIAIPNYKTVVIDGTVKMKDGTVTSITQDVAINGNQFYVTSTTEFSVGQLVGWYDDNRGTQGGGVQTRKTGGCGYITNIDTDNKIITVDYGTKWVITASANAKLGHYPITLKIAAASKHIHIYGDGKVDGNMSTQIDIDGVYNDAVSIEYGGSGLFVKQCTTCSIKGRNQLEFTNNVLHGIAFLGGTGYISRYITIDKVKCHLNHDKNLLFYGTDYSTVTNYVGNNSLFEDGIIYYAGNSHATANNISCSGNRRGGFYANSNENLGLVADNLTLSGNGFYDLVVNSSNVTITNVNINGNSLVTGQRYSVWVSSFYGYGATISISNLAINGVISPLYGVIGLIGQLNGVEINECSMSNCSGVGIIADDGDLGGYPANVDFIGGGIYNHTGTKTNIQGTSDVTFTDFEGL